MDAALFVVVLFLALFQLPCSQSLTCDDNICFPSDGETAFCCGYDYDECCYSNVNVAYLWWFWLLLVLGISLFIGCCVWGCCYSRRRSQGYVVVRNQVQSQAPAVTVVNSNQSSSQVVGPPVYHPGYQQYGAVTSGPPPAYAYQPPPPHNPYAHQKP